MFLNYGYIFVAQVKLYAERVVGDFDQTPEPLRKPLVFAAAQKLHQATGLFLFFLAKLEAMAPASGFQAMKTSLLEQFKSTLMDADLAHCLEQQVPSNADIKSISGFRLGFHMVICL